MAKKKAVKKIKRKIPTPKGGVNRRTLEKRFYRDARKMYNLIVPESWRLRPNDIGIRITRIGIYDDNEFGFVCLMGRTIFTVIEGFGNPVGVDVKNAVEGTYIAMGEVDADDNINMDLRFDRFIMVIIEDEPQSDERRLEYFTEGEVFANGKIFMIKESYDFEKRRIYQMHPEINPDEPTCEILFINKNTDPEVYKLFMDTKKTLAKLGDTTVPNW